MIDLKQAVAIARQGAVDVLGQGSSSLEEIERDSYKGRDVWSITLGWPQDLSETNPNLSVPALRYFSLFATRPLQYKRFLVDVETGELVAMKLRELASQ